MLAAEGGKSKESHRQMDVSVEMTSSPSSWHFLTFQMSEGGRLASGAYCRVSNYGVVDLRGNLCSLLFG